MYSLTAEMKKAEFFMGARFLLVQLLSGICGQPAQFKEEQWKQGDVKGHRCL